MATCTNCHYKWKARSLWLLGLSNKGRDCPNCKMVQYISFKDRGPLIGLGLLSGMIAIILVILFPFFMKLSDKEDTIW